MFKLLCFSESFSLSAHTELNINFDESLPIKPKIMSVKIILIYVQREEKQKKKEKNTFIWIILLFFSLSLVGSMRIPVSYNI